MDQVMFHYDTVLSDVHIFFPNARHLLTHLNHVGQPVFISKFKILSDVEKCDSNTDVRGKRVEEEEQKQLDLERDEHKDVTKEEPGEEGGGGGVEPNLDEDGDLDVTHRSRKNPVEASSRDLVCPVILQQSHFGQEDEEERTADKDEECFSNIIRIACVLHMNILPVLSTRWPRPWRMLANRCGKGPSSWLTSSCPSPPCSEGRQFSSNRSQSSVLHRMTFTLRHMDVSCEAYNHFSLCLSQLQDLGEGRCSFRVEKLPADFAQFLLYERVEQLVREIFRV